jgi:hypothetical protein
MKKLNLILSLLVLFILSGCNSEDDNVTSEEKNEILIFGWFADSSCSGDCSNIYKIENGKIYKDIDFNYPENTFFEGNFQLMTNADYEDYEALIIELPNEIINELNGYLDCSDCTNASGGFYLELQNDDGFHKSWRFRNALYPDYMENYRSILLDKLAELNSL